MSEIIQFTSEDGQSRIQLRADGQTVWLTQREMAELFDVSTDNIGLHLENIYAEGELRREATTEDFSVVQAEGAREVRRSLTLYNLDAILAVGYRVRSPRGGQFRRWAILCGSMGVTYQYWQSWVFCEGLVFFCFLAHPILVAAPGMGDAVSMLARAAKS